MGMTMQDLMDIQNQLQEKYKGIWEGNSPRTAQHHLLYAVEEIGEVSAIMKKRSPEAIVADENVRAHFCEEMADVLWVLICLANQTGVDLTEELRKSFEKKTFRDRTRHLDNPKLQA